MPPAFRVSTDGERQLERFIRQSGGRTVFAFVDYGHRPVTVDAAIHRGGISIDAGTAWTSRLIQSMFENRFYVTGPGSTAVSPRRYRTLIYAYRPGIDDDVSVQDRMRLLFGVRMEEYTCPFTYTFWDTLQPLPSVLTDTVVTRGCTRLRQRDVEAD
jgi:hypothetical protein